MNIVYGGSFNPPTLAHEEIVKYLLSNFNCDSLIILPVGNVYGKSDLAPFNNRYEMLKIVFKKYDKVIISDIERNQFLGTYNSLKLLSNTYKDLYFVMGADNFLNLDKWIKYESLLSEFKFIIFNRGNVDLANELEKKYYNFKDNFILIELDNKISSTDVRIDLNKNFDSIKKEIYNYIKDNNLY